MSFFKKLEIVSPKKEEKEKREKQEYRFLIALPF
jgi:hypothetical protein